MLGISEWGRGGPLGELLEVDLPRAVAVHLVHRRLEWPDAVESFSCRPLYFICIPQEIIHGKGVSMNYFHEFFHGKKKKKGLQENGVTEACKKWHHGPWLAWSSAASIGTPSSAAT